MQWTGSREHFSNYGIFHHVTANNDYNSNINPEQETPTSYSDFIDTNPEYYVYNSGHNKNGFERPE